MFPGIYPIGDVSGVPLIKNALMKSTTSSISSRASGLRLAPMEKLTSTSQSSGWDQLASQRLIANQRNALRRHEQTSPAIQQSYQAGKYIYFNQAISPREAD